MMRSLPRDVMPYLRTVRIISRNIRSPETAPPATPYSTGSHLTRSISPRAPMEIVGQDLRFAIRSLIKSPGFAVVSTVTLALAIGVNTSVFSLVSAIIFADLPMQDTETVAMVRATNPELGIQQGSLTATDFMDLRERTKSFEELSALTSNEVGADGRGSADSARRPRSHRERDRRLETATGAGSWLRAG